MLVDTGFVVTLLSKQIYDSLRKEELEKEWSILTTAKVLPMTVISFCTLNLGIANDKFSQSVMVTEGILGLDVLAGVTFDTGKGVLKC